MCIVVQKIVMKVNPFGVLVLVGRRMFLWKLSCMKDSESFTIFSQPIVLTLFLGGTRVLKICFFQTGRRDQNLCLTLRVPHYFYIYIYFFKEFFQQCTK